MPGVTGVRTLVRECRATQRTEVATVHQDGRNTGDAAEHVASAVDSNAVEES